MIWMGQKKQKTNTQKKDDILWRWSDRGGFLDRTQRLEEILMEVDRTFLH